jgi:hypothetical protein
MFAVTEVKYRRFMVGTQGVFIANWRLQNANFGALELRKIAGKWPKIGGIGPLRMGYAEKLRVSLMEVIAVEGGGFGRELMIDG